MNENELVVDIEQEYLALLINKCELLDIIQIKPYYLSNEQHQLILNGLIESYKKSKAISIPSIVESNPKIDVGTFTEIFTETICFTDNWKNRLNLLEGKIIENFKKNYSKKLIKDYEQGKINYDDFISKINKINTLELNNQVKPLTAEEIQEEIKGKTKITLHSFPKLNKVLNLVYGDFLVIGALTGNGKSSFLLNLMVDLMQEYQCIYFNMEMSKSTIYKRILSITADVPVSDVTNPQTEYQKGIIDNAYKIIEKSKIIIEHQANDINSIKKVLAKNKNINKHTILFLDHIGLIKANSSKTLYENSTEVAKELRQMCLEYDCTIISASQLNRSAYSNELSISMLKDSGEIENSSSKTMLINRFKDDQPITEIDLEVAKNRDGLTGIIIMKYDKTKQIFKEKEIFNNGRSY